MKLLICNREDKDINETVLKKKPKRVSSLSITQNKSNTKDNGKLYQSKRVNSVSNKNGMEN